MMNGAMIWWSFQKRKAKGASDWSFRWYIIQRGIFLILLQMSWVNSSWSGFQYFQPWHLGIIACIGFSMILQSFIVNVRWQIQLLIALAILLIHPLLLKIPYDTNDTLVTVLMQTFIDSGEFNKYPVLPWFAVALLGSVMANGWLKTWDSDKKRILMGLAIAAFAFLLAIIIRISSGYGNILSFSEFGSYSFFFYQKYPPSLFFSILFFGASVLSVSIMIAVNKLLPKILIVFDIVGRTALFFYCMHIAILGVFVKRIDFYYREGEVAASLIGVAVVLLIMIPLSKWFDGVKRRSKNYIIRMI
jgi:uncharacterized membrane protein